MDEAALLDEAMLAWFPPLGTVELSTRSTFTETDLRGISDLLYRSGKPSWSRIPRIYTTLRLINELEVIDKFLDRGITDLSLPFKQRTLPGQLKDQSSRVRFLDVQSRVLTKALDLEKEGSKHRHFSQPEEVPLKKIAELGKGSYGYVDKVLSTVTYREYARKQIPRGRTFRQDRVVLHDFEKELQALKKLSHQHIVRLIGSYTDPQYVGIIMAPVADCNLKAILNTHVLSQETYSRVRTFYGCLASALRYLHENQFRHKDIKPENVLVKAHEVYLTDFGTTLDWSDVGHSTTTGPASKGTIRYCAPEVATSLPRRSSADIWSLGCVFLEMWTKLCGLSISDLDYHMELHGSGSSLYHANCSAVNAWCDMLSSRDSIDAQIPGPWIRSMLQADPEMRISVQSLVEEIHHASSDPEIPVIFAGLCCNEEHDVAETVATSVYQANIMSSRASTIVFSTRPSTPMHALASRNPFYNRPLSYPVIPEMTFDLEDRRSNSSPASVSSNTTVIARHTGTNPFWVDEDTSGVALEEMGIALPYEKSKITDRSRRCHPILKPKLNFPDKGDQRTVNEVLCEWLSEFAEDPFWSFTILTGFERHPGYRLLHRLGDKKTRFHQALKALSNRLFASHEPANQEFMRNIVSIMDRMDVPYIVHSLGFTCFYPDGILSGFGKDSSIGRDGSIEVDGLQALSLLDKSRRKALEWWHDCLTAPRQTWYEKLKSTRVICIQLDQVEFTPFRVGCREDRSSVETSSLHRESFFERKNAGAKLCVGASFKYLCQRSTNPHIRAIVSDPSNDLHNLDQVLEDWKRQHRYAEVGRASIVFK